MLLNQYFSCFAKNKNCLGILLNADTDSVILEDYLRLHFYPFLEWYLYLPMSASHFDMQLYKHISKPLTSCHHCL